MKLNYTMGKKLVDKKIDSGTWKWLSYDSPDYRIEVNKSKPVPYKNIIESFLVGSPIEKYYLPTASRMQGWFSKVLTACYILCAAFTGMRRNELYGLHSDSFKTRIFNGKTIYTRSVLSPQNDSRKRAIDRVGLHLLLQAKLLS